MTGWVSQLPYWVRPLDSCQETRESWALPLPGERSPRQHWVGPWVQDKAPWKEGGKGQLRKWNETGPLIEAMPQSPGTLSPCWLTEGSLALISLVVPFLHTLPIPLQSLLQTLREQLNTHRHYLYGSCEGNRINQSSAETRASPPLVMLAGQGAGGMTYCFILLRKSTVL